MNIYEFYKNIKNKKDFEEFLRLLKIDFDKNRDSWDNDKLELFLDGLYGYNYGTTGKDNYIEPSWQLFAEMLLAAKVYE